MSAKSESDNHVVVEFGGTLGCSILMIWSHCVLLYFWMSFKFYDGAFFLPNDFFDIISKLKYACPNLTSFLIYFGFIGFQLLLALVLPGPLVKGLKVPSENNKIHTYKCNAAGSWWITVVAIITLYKLDIYNPTVFIDNLGSIMVTGMIFSDILSFIIYFSAIIKKKAIRMTGSFIYDFFMGAYLNPKFGIIDLKLFAEIRASWMQLFLITSSAAIKQYNEYGFISKGMFLILLAQFLYCNACMKGEECVVTTWDIFYEKFGWMLIFWNLAGVPYLYCFQSLYLLKNPNLYISNFTFTLLVVVLIIAYYIWDTSQSQRNRFRAKMNNSYIKRWTFPQLPWGTLETPKYMKTEVGSELLIDGWWKYARKIHYTCDIVMSIVWAMSCSDINLSNYGILPFFYPVFFTGMIIHRYNRDVERCKRKYKQDWNKYCEIVPYAFIPYVI
jgi:delta24(24(1))-sterol reductase